LAHKRGFWAPDLLGEGIPQISDMHFETTLTSDPLVGYALVLFRELRVADEKKKEES